MTPVTRGAERVVRTSRPVPLGAVLGVFRRGAGDPTSRRDDEGGWWFAWRTPDGPVTLRLRTASHAPEVTANAWGSGADWMLERVPDLLGERDDPEGFEAHHPQVADAWRSFGDWRVPRSGLVVGPSSRRSSSRRSRGKEAFSGYRRLVRRFGEPAPGPGEAMWLACRPTRVAGPRSRRGSGCGPAWTRPGRGPSCGRCGTRDASRSARPPTRCGARAGSRALPGVGRWTWAEVAQRALGLPDEVSFGDYHIAKNIGWALTGKPVDDDGLARLLEPYAGHRYRVQRLLELAGAFRPRRGPRMSPRTHLPVTGR